MIICHCLVRLDFRSRFRLCPTQAKERDLKYREDALQGQQAKLAAREYKLVVMEEGVCPFPWPGPNHFGLLRGWNVNHRLNSCNNLVGRSMGWIKFFCQDCTHGKAPACMNLDCAKKNGIKRPIQCSSIESRACSHFLV